MDRHDQAEGTVDMMVSHQQHLGPHMKWTRLRTANTDDAGRADQIVQTLRQALAKYKDYRVAMDDGYVPLHPEREAKGSGMFFMSCPRVFHDASLVSRRMPEIVHVS